MVQKHTGRCLVPLGHEEARPRSVGCSPIVQHANVNTESDGSANVRYSQCNSCEPSLRESVSVNDLHATNASRQTSIPGHHMSNVTALLGKLVHLKACYVT